MARSDRVILPGGEGYVNVTVKTRDSHGPFTVGISMQTNDPALSMVRFKIKVDVRVIYRVEPQMIQFTAFQNHGGQQTLSVSEVNSLPFAILNIDSGLPFVETVLTDHPDGYESKESSFYLILKSSPDAPAGVHSAVLTLMTDHPDKPFLEIDYSVRVFPEIYTDPVEILMTVGAKANRIQVRQDDAPVRMLPDFKAPVLERLEAGQVFMISDIREPWYQIRTGEGKKVWIHGADIDPIHQGQRYVINAGKYGDPNFRILNTRTDIPVLAPTILGVQEDYTYSVGLVYTGEYLEGLSYKGTLILETNQEQMPEIRVPATINLREGSIKDSKAPEVQNPDFKDLKHMFIKNRGHLSGPGR